MNRVALAGVAVLVCAGGAGGWATVEPESEPEHAANPVFVALRDAEGIRLDGVPVRLSPPRLHDALSADAQRDVVRELAGSDRALDELMRASVTAPILSRLNDIRDDAVIVRQADIAFILHTDLDDLDPSQAERWAADPQAMEAGNMRFEGRRLTEEDLHQRGIERVEPTAERAEGYVHLTGRLLDRIGVRVTDRIHATRADDSLVVAWRTDPTFDDDATLANQWWPITRRGAREEAGTPRPYGGGVGYAKASRLKFEPGAVFVEVHAAFAEPYAWFDGAPVLRSKITLVAQEQVRSLRRELARDRRQAQGR